MNRIIAVKGKNFDTEKRLKPNSDSELRQIEDFLKDIFDRIPVLLLVQNSKGETIYFNKTWKKSTTPQ